MKTSIISIKSALVRPIIKIPIDKPESDLILAGINTLAIHFFSKLVISSYGVTE
jgi:hypothetical protein